MKRATQVTALAAAAALALAACGAAPEDEETTGGEDTAGGNPDFSACMVSDAGGFDDQSFNQSGYEGLLKAEDELGITIHEVESQADTDYGPNIDNLVQQGCNLVIGVGFLLEDPIQAAAEANTDTNFALIDSAFSDADFNPVELDNAKPILFNTAEAAFLAGYLAAGMTESGTVATFGGIQIPSVAIFMDGFVDGVAKYNEDNGTEVETLGWDKEAQTGTFTGDFENQANGQNVTQGFIDQGADIIMPVAGPVGLGAAAAAEGADAKIIWVDSDGFLTTDYGSIILTSVMKQIGPAVFDTVSEAADDGFSSEPYVGTLENEGVGLAPFHDFEDAVPTELQDKLAEYQEQIIAGDLVVESPNTP
ncbi:BMP family lipoprotein [Cellulosimicrobium marinum]|uniref:BMP family lipoprotein n=1 Tax=Cellulosimicrobium marinum TaxID=1638992 RepID=UPI001E5BBFB9|nr:BMP family ABC transporter substrate-binding protein [Cellulosimicrobium marinum]MCB7136494.1 BMP family ABC transporter substrate-binding protein [Cellulosimicrobium marinum]